MTIISYPFDGDEVDEDDWTLLFQEKHGVNSDTLGNAVQLRADGSGANVFVRVGSGWIRGHYFEVTAEETVAVPTNSTRVDRIVLRLNPATDGVTAVRIAGTPGSSTPPAYLTSATGTTDLNLGLVTVVNGVTNFIQANLTDERLFVGLPSQRVLLRAHIITPVVGRLYYEAATSSWIGWNGSSFRTLQTDVPGIYSPILHDGSGIPGGAVVGPGRFRVGSGMCDGFGSSTYNDNNTWSGFGAYFDLPLPTSNSMGNVVEGAIVGHWSVRNSVPGVSPGWGLVRLVGAGSSLVELRSSTNTRIDNPPERNNAVNVTFNYPVY